MPPCIFCKIVAGEIPSTKIYEDENLLAFLDINPVHKGHALLIPKKHFESSLYADDATLALLGPAAKKIAHAVIAGAQAQGCNISSNNGAASGQDVFHAHWHIIPRFDGDNLNRWPHGHYASDEEKELIAEKIKKLL